MIANQRRPTRRLWTILLPVASLILVLLLPGCSRAVPTTEELEAVNYAPLPGDDWDVSTPDEEGVDPLLVAELYLNAAELETIYGLLVVKDGKLIAEGYFNGWSAGRKVNVQSVTKSYMSALVGVALQQGCLSNTDQKMLSFFPELAPQIADPRKEQVTIRQMLQMRAGYPWEESDPGLWEALWSGDYLPLIVHFPLTYDPGSDFEHSNLTSDWLGMIVARACETDLKAFAQEHLFAPLGVEVGDWTQDQGGYHMGHGEMHFTAREMVRFGQLYLDDGATSGEQIISPEWVRDSLQTYSEDAWEYPVGPHFKDIGYGYQWWSARTGEQRLNLAWGHGGQLIVLVDDLDLVAVVVADPLYGQTGDEPWAHEKANINLVADFFDALPSR